MFIKPPEVSRQACVYSWVNMEAFINQFYSTVGSHVNVTQPYSGYVFLWLLQLQQHTTVKP